MDGEDVSSQLNLLKEKIKNKEKEIAISIQAHKEEYERNAKEKDEEVTAFVDNLIKENIELKKQIVLLEIELERKETNEQNPTSNINNSDNPDRLFYDNLKQIRDSHETKQKEIIEKYDKFLKNLTKDHRHLISSFKKLAQENKLKIINEEISLEQLNKNENLISLNSAEEQFNIYENRIRLLYEELKTKEKYSLVVEQKYEMINEENKLLKRKIQEEKATLLKMVSDVQREHSSSHVELMNKVNTEIYQKKNLLESYITNSLSKSEELVDQLLKEKNTLKNEIKNNQEEIKRLNNHIVSINKEKEEIEKIIQKQKNEVREANQIKEQHLEELKKLNMDKEILTKANNDLTIRINDLMIKIVTIETESKIIKDSVNKEIEKSEIRNKAIIESLNNDLIEAEKKARDNLNKKLSQNENMNKLNSTVTELTEQLDNANNTIKNLKTEISEKSFNIQLLDKNAEEMKINYDKLSEKYKLLENNLNEKLADIRTNREKLVENESEIKSLKNEINRLTLNRDELQSQVNENSKNNTLIANQYDTLKVSSNIEIQRLKNQIIELEKMTEKIHKVSILESSLNEVKKDNRELRLLAGKAYKVFMEKLGVTENNHYDEKRMLEEITSGLDKLIDKHTEIAIRENDSINNEKEKYEEEIRNLKKKLSALMQMTNNMNSNTSSSNNSNSTFKQAEKDKPSSLYESLIIYLKNLNLKHLLEIFQLNMQREEEIRTILNDKNSNNISSNTKKQIADLNSNYISLKKLCEQAFNEYLQRSKMYIQAEEYQEKLEEYKNFTQNLLDMILNTFMNYKVEFNDAIVFKFPINDYNQMIENIQLHLENFNKTVNSHIEQVNKNAVVVEKAIDVLTKQTTVDFESMNNLMKEKFI